MDSMEISSKNIVLSSALANAALLIAAPKLGCLNTYTRTLTDLFRAYSLPIPDLRHALQYRPMSPSSSTLDIPTDCHNATTGSGDSKYDVENGKNRLGFVKRQKMGSDTDRITDISDGCQEATQGNIDEDDIKIEEIEVDSVKHETTDSYSDFNDASIHVHNIPVSIPSETSEIIFISSTAPHNNVLASTLDANTGSKNVDMMPEYNLCVKKLTDKSSEHPSQYHNLQHAQYLQQPPDEAPDHPPSHADQLSASSTTEDQRSQFHHLTVIPPSVNGKRSWKKCCQCFFERKQRKDTFYHCLMCSMAPGLCCGKCANAYHARMGISRRGYSSTGLTNIPSGQSVQLPVGSVDLGGSTADASPRTMT